MKAILDTNVVLRYLLNDDARQATAARTLMAQARGLVLPTPVLCEVAWILSRTLKIEKDKVADAIETLLKSPKVETRDAAVSAGIAFLRAGGDFSDGVIAGEGRDMGGNVFFTFDKGATKLHAKLFPAPPVKRPG